MILSSNSSNYIIVTVICLVYTTTTCVILSKNKNFVVSGFSSSSSSITSKTSSLLHSYSNNNKNKPITIIAPETTSEQRSKVSDVLQNVFGQPDSDQWFERRQKARRQEDSEEAQNTNNYEQHQLVYGELGLEALCTILDAVEVKKGDKFLDIGSGDGHLVQAAALLWPNYLKVSRGIELLDFLYERSIEFDNQIINIENNNIIVAEEKDSIKSTKKCPTELYVGDIYSVAAKTKTDTDTIDIDDTESSSSSTSEQQQGQQQIQQQIQSILQDTTIAICFATTWTRGIPGRKLPLLALALQHMPIGSKIVVVDGKLELENINNSNDLPYYEYHGQFKFTCPDTAPYSIAHLYERI